MPSMTASPRVSAPLPWIRARSGGGTASAVDTEATITWATTPETAHGGGDIAHVSGDDLVVDQSGLYNLRSSGYAVVGTPGSVKGYINIYTDLFDPTQDPDVDGMYGGSRTADTWTYQVESAYVEAGLPTTTRLLVVDYTTTMWIEEGSIFRAFSLSSGYDETLTLTFRLMLRQLARS